LFEQNISLFSLVVLNNLVGKKRATFVFEQIEEFTLQLQERETLLYWFQLEFHCPLKSN
jgi:hypothetical protein